MMPSRIETLKALACSYQNFNMKGVDVVERRQGHDIRETKTQ
jgi:hypothetical protein